MHLCLPLFYALESGASFLLASQDGRRVVLETQFDKHGMTMGAMAISRAQFLVAETTILLCQSMCNHAVSGDVSREPKQEMREGLLSCWTLGAVDAHRER